MIHRLATLVATAVLTLAPGTAFAHSDTGTGPLTSAGTGGVTSGRFVPNEEAPPAVIANRATDTLSLYDQAGLTPSKSVSRQLAGTQPAAAQPPVSAFTNTTPSGQVLPPGIKDHVDQVCTGTGTDGARAQVMYVREADQPDRYSQVAPILRNEMRYIDDAFAVSSNETGGGKRVRWVTNSDCSLNVLNVVLPDGAITGSFEKTKNALQVAGYDKTNRKYVAFADVPVGGLGGNACGMADEFQDSSPTNNANDGRYAQTARIDLECWVNDAQFNAAALHEFLHTLGAVQQDAPHGTSLGHCTDSAEVMCYFDGTATINAVCPQSQKFDIDCNNDDYFNTNPATGSYLATHWNTANSSFLATVDRLPAAPAVSVSSNNASPATGDIVTFTANVATGVAVSWEVDIPECKTNGATTGTSFSIQCFNEAKPTVTASATNSSISEGYATQTVTYAQGAYPELVVDAPDTAAAGQSFSMTATVVRSSATWTYRWSNLTAGCTSSNLTTAVLTQTCSDAVAGQFSSAKVTATRTADGTVLSTTTGVQIVAAGAPAVNVTGPSTVGAGQAATFTATVSNVSGTPTYAWVSNNRWQQGSSTGSSFTVTPPADTRLGSDTIYLTVTAPNGKQTTTSFVYDVTLRLAVDIAGPTSLTSGTYGTFTAAVTKPATLSWRVDNAACSIAVASATQAQLFCASGLVAGVTVTATAQSGSETAVASRTVSVVAAGPSVPVVVTPPPVSSTSPPVSTPSSPSAAKVTVRASRAPGGLKATVTGSKVAGIKVTLQKQVGKKWVRAGAAKTNAAGIAVFKVNPKTKTVYRWVVTGGTTSNSVSLT